MYSEFLSMSNSELFLIKNDQEFVIELLGTPSLIFEDGELQQIHDEEEEEEEDRRQKKEEKCLEERERPSLGEFKVEEDDDGFKTPTSLDHKIPVIKQCPPAPRKPKSSSTKRKVSSQNNTVRRSTPRLDLSKEVESLFHPHLLSDFQCKIKKSRREDHELERF